MVSFTDHYNAIFIDRFSSQTKIGKDSWYFNNSLICKAEFSSTRKTFFIKNTKKGHSSGSDWWETLNLVLKMLELSQLENKQVKSVKLRWELESKKCSKTFFKRQNMQNQTIFELYILMIYSSSPKDIIKSTKKN